MSRIVKDTVAQESENEKKEHLLQGNYKAVDEYDPSFSDFGSVCLRDLSTVGATAGIQLVRRLQRLRIFYTTRIVSYRTCWNSASF